MAERKVTPGACPPGTSVAGREMGQFMPPVNIKSVMKLEWVRPVLDPPMEGACPGVRGGKAPERRGSSAETDKMSQGSPYEGRSKKEWSSLPGPRP